MKRVQLPRSLMELSTDAERTCQRAIREVEFGDVVAKLANVRRKCEARVVVEAYIDSLRFHANNLEGKLACARAPS